MHYDSFCSDLVDVTFPFSLLVSLYSIKVAVFGRENIYAHRYCFETEFICLKQTAGDGAPLHCSKLIDLLEKETINIELVIPSDNLLQWDELGLTIAAGIIQIHLPVLRILLKNTSGQLISTLNTCL